MQSVEAKIRISSNLLREPHVFERLGPPGQAKANTTEGGLARDILLWASWKNTLLVQLNVPDFCKMLGYDRRHVLRALTPDQVDVMLQAGFLPKSLDRKEPGNVNCLIAYVITVMFTRTLPFANRDNTSTRQSFHNKLMVRDLHVFEKKKRGTVIEFSLSDEVLETSRGDYQTIDLGDYLSLVTKGKEATDDKPAKSGAPDDAARKLYWHLLWKRQYWDHLEKTGKLRKGYKPSESFYPELVLIAGLQSVTPAKVQAYRMRKLLERVSELPSINMELAFRLNPSTGSYEATWKRNKLTEEGKPTEKPTPFPCEPAPATWGTDPNPPAQATRTVAPAPKINRPSLLPAKAAARPTTAAPRRAKLLDQLADAKNSVQWLLKEDVKKSFEGKEPGTYEKYLAEAHAKVEILEQEVRG
jgi:hypothetical protein